MDTDQLEHDTNERCHESMSGKAPTDGVFGTVQARGLHLSGALGLDDAPPGGDFLCPRPWSRWRR